jgi:hypothetical protein
MSGIELREGEPELLIDNVPTRYGQLSDRLYFMHEYAYWRHYYLMNLARANLGDRLRSIIRDGRTLQDVMREVEREREGCTFWLAATNGSYVDSAVPTYEPVSSGLSTPYKVCLPKGGRL